MTMSLLNCALHSAATLQTCITASGSSALTWNIGASTTYNVLVILDSVVHVLIFSTVIMCMTYLSNISAVW